ncbi:GNAT family N-acetyltransferase [Nocardioides agariphilus]|jgi:GNAT superfamily N-acetyltransferase|uniref:GNAT family N-acetyltransferase n=1 Tax=Nocardioides agariphilus TaxID=433664 RepID=A0A930YGI3_9ACTN|nr:GNAT family N-acetyltransferase [Nocardioides agariphilus]MBF4767606.1 GNAT family N-acetyltransferase [Nocardioides agariphilus]
MSRKVTRLTLDHLDELTAPCRSCVFWQLDPVRRERVRDTHGAYADEVDAWVSLVLREWGSCGRVVLVDGVAKGFALYAPEAFLPGAASFATAPVSADAVLLTQVYVAPDARHGGLGRMLVQGMARDLVERGIKAVEAFGDTRGDPGWDSHQAPRDHPRGSRCVASVDFLGSVGFKTHRPHARNPRMRMDLRSSLRWRDEVEAALEKLIGVVRPAPKPSPERRSGELPG